MSYGFTVNVFYGEKKGLINFGHNKMRDTTATVILKQNERGTYTKTQVKLPPKKVFLNIGES